MSENLKQRRTKSTSKPKGKTANRAKPGRKVPTLHEMLQDAGRKWLVRVEPMETVSIAEDALLCQMIVRNLGPATVEVRIEDSESSILLPGRLSILPAYGAIRIESLENNYAIMAMAFLPRSPASAPTI